MPKEAAFTVELESDLRDALFAEAEAARRPPSELVRDLIDEFIRQQRDARAHDAWFRTEVDQALREADDPAVARVSNEEIEARWERKRAELIRRTGGPGLEG